MLLKAYPTVSINRDIACRNLECLLINAANDKEFEHFFESVTLFYKKGFDRALLSAQLQNLRTCFVDSDKIVSLGVSGTPS